MTMLPRLQAEEQLDAIRAGGLAFGGYKPDAQREMMARLHKIANGHERRPRARKPKPAMLGSMGIGMKLVPIKSAGSEASQGEVSHG
jgi:hypothetical protein